MSYIQIHIDVWHIFTTNIVEHFSPFTRLWFYFAGTQGKGLIVLSLKNIVTTNKQRDWEFRWIYQHLQNLDLDPTLKAQIDRMVDIPSNQLVVILSAMDWTVFKKKEKLSSLKVYMMDVQYPFHYINFEDATFISITFKMRQNRTINISGNPFYNNDMFNVTFDRLKRIKFHMIWT